MKKYTTLVCSLFSFFCFFSTLSAQYTDWEFWHHGEYAYSIVPDGPDLYIGTNGGLITLDTLSAQTQHQNSTNSSNLYARARNVTLDGSGGIWKCNNGSLSHLSNGSWTQYDTTYFGLPQYALFRDISVNSQGQAWIATTRGLIQDAGGTFTLHDSSNSPIPSEYLECLQVDFRDQSIWAAGYFSGFGTQFGRIFHFDGTNWSIYDSTNALLFDSFIHEIDQHPITGDIWTLTNKGLQQFDGTTWTLHPTNIPQLPDSVFREMAIDAQGNLYLGSTTGVIAKFDGTNWTAWSPTTSDLKKDWISAIYPASPDRIWISQSGTNLALYNGQGQIIHAYDLGNSPIQSSYLNSIEIDPQGRKVFGSAFGLHRFDDAANSWEVFDQTNSPLDSGKVTLMEIDLNDHLWARTGNTFHQFDGLSNWNSYPPDSFPFPFYSLTAFTSDDSAGFWLGSFDNVAPPYLGYLSHFDGTNWTVYDTSNFPLAGNLILSIEGNDSGATWVATNMGLAYLYQGNWTIYTLQNGMASDQAIIVKDDNQGNVWVHHGSIGVSRLSGGQWTLFPDSTIGNLSPNWVFMEVDALGEVWVGSPASQITYHYNGSSWDAFSLSNTGLHGLVTGIAKDSVGNTWFATSYGLSAWRNGGVLLDRAANWPADVGAENPPIVFPNPFSDRLNVEIELLVPGSVKVSWLDMQGRLLREEVRHNNAIGQQTIKFERKGLPSGPMILRVEYGDVRSATLVVAQ